jgi:protein-tyrosine phosphatase
MAEFMMKKLVREKGLEQKIFIASAATSKYEEGMSVHRGTRQILDREGITDYHDKRSTPLKKTDYEKYDYIIGMDEENKVNINRIFGGDPDKKVGLLLDYTEKKGEVADPYWTGDFEATYRDVKEGTEGLLEFLISQKI